MLTTIEQEMCGVSQVGDTLDTDIELAVRSGMRSLLVLSTSATAASMHVAVQRWPRWRHQPK